MCAHVCVDCCVFFRLTPYACFIDCQVLVMVFSVAVSSDLAEAWFNGSVVTRGLKAPRFKALRETLMTKYGDKTPTVETLTKWIDEETAKRLKVCMVCLMVVRLVGMHTRACCFKYAHTSPPPPICTHGHARLHTYSQSL